MAEAEHRGRGRGGPRGRGRGSMKRPMPEAHEYDDYSEGFSKKRKIMDDVYRFLVREDLVKIVIGKGGENIKAIKEEAKGMGIETKVSIYAQNSDGTPLMDGARDRVMSVQSTEDGLTMALTHIVPVIQTQPQLRGGRGRGRGRGHDGSFGEQRRVKLELRLVVPGHCCSGIIGKGGSVIKSIKEETNSYIQVYTLPLPNSEEYCVRIQNFEPDDLVLTALKVFQSIADIKGRSPVKMYDPIYFEHGEHGDTGSYIDTEWYQEALRSGVAQPTPYSRIKDSLAASSSAYLEDPYADTSYEESYEYDDGYSYYGYEAEEEYVYEEPYYQPPVHRPRGSVMRGRAAPHRPARPSRARASFAARGSSGALPRGGHVPRASGMSGARGRGGSPMRPFHPRGAGRAAPRAAYGRGRGAAAAPAAAASYLPYEEEAE